MKTIVLHDENGNIIFTTNSQYSGVLSVQTVEIPDGKQIDTVDGETGEVLFKDIPKSETQLMKEQITAIYEKVSEGYTGTAENPIPWVYGMECREGLCYSYKGTVYRVAAGGYMNPCVWEPGSAGLWQFEAV